MQPSFSNVVMVGTDPNMKGGIASVISGYISYNLFENLGIKYISTHISGNKSDKIIFFIKSLQKLTIALRNCSILHIHTASWWSFRRLSILMSLSMLFDVPYVIHLHGGMFHKYYSNAGFIEQSYIKLFFNKAHSIIVLNQHWKMFVQSLTGKELIYVIPNSVRMPKNSICNCNTRDNDLFRILFLGEIVNRKGIQELIECASILRKFPVKFYLGGIGDIENYRKKILEKNLSKHIKLLGWVDGKDKDILFQKAFAFLLPSHYEGLPVSLLEAMSYGVPVITTGVGGIASLIEHDKNGFLVPVGDAIAIAETIKRLMGDKLLWKYISRNAIKTVEEGYSMKSTQNALLECYRKIIADEPSKTLHK